MTFQQILVVLVFFEIDLLKKKTNIDDRSNYIRKLVRFRQKRKGDISALISEVLTS